MGRIEKHGVLNVKKHLSYRSATGLLNLTALNHQQIVKIVGKES